MSAELEVLAVGEPLVAFIAGPPDVPLHEVSAYGVHVTGAELNTAVGLSRLSHRVAFAGRVGADPFGEVIRRRLLAERVDVRWLSQAPQHPTGMLFRNLRTGAAPEVVYRRAGSAGASLRVDDVREALAEAPAATIVLISGVTAAVAPAATTQIVREAARAGHRVCLDLNYRARLWSREDAASVLRPLLDDVSLIVGDEEEARLLTDERDPHAAARALLQAGVATVVLRHDVTAATLWSSTAGEPCTCHAVHRAAPRDPIGAGDAFLAGLVSGLLEFGDDAVERCLRRAHTCGAAVIDTVGDIEGALSRAELERQAGGDGGGSEALR